MKSPTLQWRMASQCTVKQKGEPAHLSSRNGSYHVANEPPTEGVYISGNFCGCVPACARIYLGVFPVFLLLFGQKCSFLSWQRLCFLRSGLPLVCHLLSAEYVEADKVHGACHGRLLRWSWLERKNGTPPARPAAPWRELSLTGGRSYRL